MKKRNSIEEAALTVTRSVGSPTSIVVHTILFAASFLAVHFDFISFDRMLLVLTTIVSLEAIYLAIFIQMTINYTTQAVEEVAEDVEEMQEDVEEIQEDIDELQEDVEEISEDVEDIEESDDADEKRKAEQRVVLATIQTDLKRLMEDINKLQSK
jgi:septal ring factor EnvC (AmiA/AmiB activator)